MTKLEDVAPAETQPSPSAIREQLETLVQDPVFRSSKRSIQFLRYVVEQTLSGAADKIKERTIGVEVFGRNPSYDTATDHIVRTAAIELRRRLAAYYSDERHRNEVKMSLFPGSYVPKFSLPVQKNALAAETVEGEDKPQAAEIISLSAETGISIEARGHQSPAIDPYSTSLIQKLVWAVFLMVLGAMLVWGAMQWYQKENPVTSFWKPVLNSSGSVLLAVGDVPVGPPSIPANNNADRMPLIQRGLETNVPLSDTVTIARVLNALESRGKKVVIRTETASKFSDFKEGPVVLIGAFNNEWSVRLTHDLRFSLALDPERHLIYIRDAKNPTDRSWSQVTGQTVQQQQAIRGGPARFDYALVSRVWNPETGQVVVVIGGLYAYGTEAAGEFVTTAERMQALSHLLPFGDPKRNVQIVLKTAITDDTPGLPEVLATSDQ